MAIVPDSGSTIKDRSYTSAERLTAGTPNGTIMPNFVGELVYDTVNKIVWKAVGTGNNHWVPLRKRALPYVPGAIHTHAELSASLFSNSQTFYQAFAQIPQALTQSSRFNNSQTFNAHTITQPGDAYFNTTVLTLNIDGANNSTTFTDVSHANRGNASAVAGNAKVDTSVTDGGKPSAKFDGAGDAIYFANHADFDFADQHWWVECRCRFNTVGAGQQWFLSKWQQTFGMVEWVFAYNGTGDDKAGFTYSTTAGGSYGGAYGVISAATGAFHDYAANYDGNKIRVFKDGTMVASATVGAVTIYSGGADLVIGNDYSNSAGPVDGWISRVRINKGSDRGVGDAGYTPEAPGHFLLA